MPRAARLDVLGVVQHVIARGSDGQEIFRDGKDRAAFLERLRPPAVRVVHDAVGGEWVPDRGV